MKEEKTITELYGFLQEHMVTKNEFYGLETKVDGIEKRMDRVENRLGQVENRLGRVENRLDGVENRLDGVEKELGEVKNRVSSLEIKFTSTETRIENIEANMVTKDYLDRKIFDFRGDLVVLLRKEDDKLFNLISLLRKKEILDDTEVNQLSAMRPFPKFAI